MTISLAYNEIDRQDNLTGVHPTTTSLSTTTVTPLRLTI